MVDEPVSLQDLAAHAHESHVVVVGGGIGGLVAALECAKVGLRVTVLEASDRLGGLVRSAEVAGLTLDVGAESFATRGGHVRALVDELGLGDEVVTPVPGGAWVAGLPGAAPLPKGGLLGIPENPFTDDVRAVIGWRGAWRAYVDRLRPPLTIGHEHSLGKLVRSRMGDRVLERLVAPVTSGVYSADPDDIDVEIAAPGLSAALTRAGSLSGAVSSLVRSRTAASGSAPPGSAVEGITGGMWRLVDAIAERLDALDVDVRLNTPVEAVEAAADASAFPRVEGRWRIRIAGETIGADHVIVATGEASARTLLSAILEPDDLERAAPRVHIVTLVLDAPQLDDAPRGSGVLTVPGTHRAKALTHATAKWRWLADAASTGHPHRHVVRVSFGSQSEPPATEGLAGDAVAELALAEASALLGVHIDPSQVAGFDIARYEQSLPGAAIGQRDAADAVRARLATQPGLVAVGAWLSGTGLAQVVPDARAQAETVRRAALFGSAPNTD